MKKFTLLLLLFLAPALQAQQWQTLTAQFSCGPFREIVKVLTNQKFQETPLWIGNNDNDPTNLVLFLNADSGNWTMLQYFRDTACILGMGQTSNIVNLAPFGGTKN